ncbi:MAG TPA: hypothetical protein VK184_12315 [Nostocaceae cyanobacterium]|nr:hypothetical protein [Nostocaceae cyanobacterium]
MVVARKAVVSTKNTWLEQNLTPSTGQSRSTRLESTKVNPKRKRRTTSSNFSVSPINSTDSITNLESNTKANIKVNEPLMSPNISTPVWLMRLYAVNRYSATMAFLFVVVALVVYGWTVYSQELWGKNYRRLQNLQRHERQLTTTNATLTSKIAQEAEQTTTGLVAPSPQGAIFLPSASEPLDSDSASTTPDSETPQQATLPLGY